MACLRLYDGRDSDEMIRRLKDAKQAGKALSTLEVSETVLEEHVIEAIVDFLLEIPIDTVQLYDCGAYLNKQADRMARALGNVKSLRLLEPTFVTQFFLDSLLLSANKLENLRIQDNLGVQQMQALATGLKANKILQSLDLSRSRLDADSVSTLVKGLRDNSSLRSIKLRSLNLGDEQVTEIGNALKYHPYLKALDLSFNQCRSLDSVASFVNQNPRFQELSVGYQNVWKAPKLDITRLTIALHTNTSLTTLSLARNKINDLDAELLATTLRENSIIQNIDLKENRIGDRGVNFLADAIATNTGLRKVNLTKNPFFCLDALLMAVRVNLNLVHVELTENSFAAQQIRYYSSLNKGGRRLLDEKPVLGLWPLVMEKVNKMDWGEDYSSSFDEPPNQALDVLYFFLQGPLLFEGLLCRVREGMSKPVRTCDTLRCDSRRNGTYIVV
jgi:Ran GTPase-activating protein (RanGAP) involved in mRNA processing and transport